ncbi:MAG: LLM class flavin-dependent oxidoreductase, partial [Zoogloeaceae bacterium]|nr:LLM class flavin-dependent oxidoreductase [Zoogloeaceae bacterium]
EFIWQLPVAGDGRYGDARPGRRGERAESARPALSPGVSDPRGDRFNYFDYLHQVARAADLAGFDGIQVPDDPGADESWIVAAYAARATRHVRVLAEFPASRGSSVFAAKNAISFQRFSKGRFAWQIGLGGNELQRRWYGDHLAETELLARIEEFVTVARGVTSGEKFSFAGRFFEVLEGGFDGPLRAYPLPPVYLSGSSEEALALSARVADIHIFDALPVAQLRPAIARLVTLAEQAGRTVTAGLRIDVLARETTREALFDARRFLDQSGARRQVGDPALGSNHWPGLSSGRNGAAASLFGSYGEVSQRLVEYVEAGVESFILGATPHLEEAYRVGELVLPSVRSLTGSARRLAA